jgi:hypothetical protein
MNHRFLACGLILLASLGGGRIWAQDAEGTAPWSLKMRHGPLDVITIPYKDGTARSVYYMTFTLENPGTSEALLGLHVKAVVGSHPQKRKVHVSTPDADVEEYIRRLSRTPELKDVQEINKMGKLEAGQSVKGIAVFGTFHREWDVATVTVAGLESRAIDARVRQYGDSGFVLSHRAYYHHNQRVRERAGPDAEAREFYAVVKHSVIWRMEYHREGDEFSPQLDPIILDREEWDVVSDPGPEIVMEKQAPFGK